MITDRTQAPPYQIIKKVTIPKADTIPLDNGLLLHVINIGEQPVLRLECLFETGSWMEEVDGTSYFAIKMLIEGTESKSGAELSDAFESMGAFTDFSHSADRLGITVYSLKRNLPAILELVKEMITTASFPEKEFEDLRNITLQNLKVNQEKTSWLASTGVRQALFGKQHPYGRIQNESSIEALQLSDVRQYYDHFIKHGRFRIIASGQVGEEEIQAINQHFGQLRELDSPYEPGETFSIPFKPEAEVIERPESIQSSIRIGKRLFTRDDPDYFKLLVTNEILGGYFGSRLMKNIREEKGLTYGISSSVVSLHREGYFMIGTDVNKDLTQLTIDEIHKEIKKLQNELVPEAELQNVKNFMAGEFAGSLNTAFEVADRQKILLLDNLPEDFFDQYITQIHATTAADIMEMANKHLQVEDMIEVIAGTKE